MARIDKGGSSPDEAAAGADDDATDARTKARTEARTKARTDAQRDARTDGRDAPSTSTMPDHEVDDVAATVPRGRGARTTAAAGSGERAGDAAHDQAAADDVAFARTVMPSHATRDAALAALGTPRSRARGEPALASGGGLTDSDLAARTLDARGSHHTGELTPLPEVSAHHYRTDAEVARGGMGRISAAFDQRLGRKVALKELLDPVGEHLARFHREAIITARLQHPSIVPVYEAGQWPTGEPFFAMKLVSGRPLDRVVGETKTLAERIALLPRIVAASEAIAYAHSQRIVHRDLKPGNILIGEYGETVVIDWGLAKDLDQDEPSGGGSTIRGHRPRAEARAASPSEHVAAAPESRSVAPSGVSTLTVAGAVMGTPAYMAPEQARGEPIDERCDVFALGAMLYHTLAGRPPYDAKTATEVIAAAADGQVVALRARDPNVPAELIAIVERAMAPEVENRYRSARELAEELRRFMTGQLVGAHHYTAWQRARRYIVRHRAAVTIAAVAVLGFAMGGTFAVRRIVSERDRAEAQRTLAVTRKAAAETLVDFMLSDLRRRLTAIGRVDLLTGLGTEVRRYYEQLADSPHTMPPDDVVRMAAALAIVAFAEGQAGNLDAAVATWNQAKERLSSSLAASPGGASAFPRRRELARAESELGYLLQQRGKVGEAAERYRESLRQLEALLAEGPDDRDALLFAATAHDRLADLLRNSGKVDESFDEYAIARQQRERVVAIRRGMDDRDSVYALSTSHARLGTVYEARGESAQSLVEYRAAARQRDSLLEAEPDNVEWQAGLVNVQTEIAALQRDLGDLASSIATYESTLPLAEALLRRDPTNTAWRRDRGNLLADFGFALMAAGRYQDALDRFDQAHDNHRELVTVDPANTAWQSDLSRFSTRAGDALQYLGRYDEARDRFEEARRLRGELSARDPKNVPWRRSLAWAHAKLAVFYTLRGAADRAIDEHEQALLVRDALVAGSKSHAGLRDELASTKIALGKLLIARDPGRAEALISGGRDLARALHVGDPLDNSYKETFASALLATAELARARGARAGVRANLTEALGVAQLALDRAGQSAMWPGFVADLHARLADVDAAEGKRDAAIAHRFEALALLEGLADSGRLPVYRKGLLARLRALTAGQARPTSPDEASLEDPQEPALPSGPPQAPGPSAPPAPSAP
ncbi:MAG: protein kinase [Kofleriaceae bacterium]